MKIRATSAVLFVLAFSFHRLPASAQTVDDFNPGFNYWVASQAAQTDGKWLFGGHFTRVGTTTRNYLARVTSTGVLDGTFNANPNYDVYAIAMQLDGKILLGGDFTSFGSTTRPAIARLNSAGTVDTTFYASVFNPPYPTTSLARIQAIALQPDGKVLVGGWCSLNGGPQSGYFARLTSTGGLDSTFSTPGVTGGKVNCIALQQDGKIVVGGSFTASSSQSRRGLARFNAEGSLDLGFSPALAQASGAYGFGMALAIQPDGKILVGGIFTGVSGQAITNLVRLNVDGSVDTNFNARIVGASPSIYSLALQTDRKILVGGIFTGFGGAAHRNICRLFPDGMVDPAFTATADLDVYALGLQRDGKTVVGGLFGSLANQLRPYAGRLNSLDAATESLSCQGSTVTWMRGGSAPEISWTTFESSTNGVDWELVGAGTRVPGGWVAGPGTGGYQLAPGGFIRARGLARGGAYTGSSWFVESIARIAPQILRNSELGMNAAQFGFHVTAPANEAVIIEASTDLTHWTQLATNQVDAAGDWLFQDPDSVAFVSRFYRARFP